MKKYKLLTAIACFALLITGCNGGNNSKSSELSSKSGTSAPSTSAPSSSSSSAAPEEDYYYSLPFPSGSKGNDNKWTKNFESKWTFNVTKNHTKVAFAISAMMTSSSHGDRTLFTNHEGASSQDAFESNEANDGTPRLELKVNGVAQTLTTKTYSEADLGTDEYVYFRIAEFAVTAGQVEISMKTHKDTGYRLYFGDDVRLFYPRSEGQDPAPVTYKVSFNANGGTGSMAEVNNVFGSYVTPDNGFTAPEGKFFAGWKLAADSGTMLGVGHKIEGINANITLYAQWAEAYVVTFVTEHCKVLVYQTKSYDDETPVEATSTCTRNTDVDPAVPTKYVAPAADVEEVKPQVNFKVVCDEGYIIKDAGIVVSGEKDVDYNNIKSQGEGIYRVTVIKKDLTITITPVVDTGDNTPDAGKITFALTNCTVKVWAGKYGEDGTVEDTGPDFYSRNKTTPSEYDKGDNAQFNFQVFPASGYELHDDSVTITGTYNNLKAGSDNSFNITKVASDLTITVVCYEIAA